MREKFERLEKQFRFGVNRVERLLRHRAAQCTGALRKRGQRRRPVNRDTEIGEPVRSAAQLAQREGQAMPQRQPVRRQLVLLHQRLERGDDGVARRQIEHGIADLAPPLPGEIGFCRIEIDGLEQQHVGVEPQAGAFAPSAASGRNR